MTMKPDEFRERLFDAQPMSPPLREAYQKELERMTSPALTPRRVLPGVIFLVVLLVCVAGIVRAMFVHQPGPLLLTAWVFLVIAFSYVSYLIARDLWRGKHSPKAGLSAANALTGAAGVMTVAALLLGTRDRADPKSMFNAFYVFVFYFACAVWALESRVAAAELAAKEQMLRVECRLADLVERLGK